MSRCRGFGFALALGTLVAGGTAEADVLGIAAGAGAWGAEPSGWIRSEGDDRFDVEDDLGLDDETTGYAWLALEHPVPVLPNLKLRHVPLSFEGDGNVGSLEFEGETFSGDIASEVELKQTDLVLYYELLDNVVSADLGVNVKLVDGFVEVEEQGGASERVDFEAPIPMLYAMVRADLPLTGLHAGVEASGIAYGDDSVLDVRAGIGYEFAFGLGVEAGYWRQSLELDDVDGVDVDLDVDGPYLGAYLDF